MSPLGVVGAVLAGIILLGGAVKAWPAVWGFVKALARVPVTIERIHTEFAPNGGGSMRDAIDDLKEDLSGVLEWQSSHEADDLTRLTELAAADAEMNTYLHNRMHELLGKLQPVVAWGPLHDKRLKRIEDLLRMEPIGDDPS